MNDMFPKVLPIPELDEVKEFPDELETRGTALGKGTGQGPELHDLDC